MHEVGLDPETRHRYPAESLVVSGNVLRLPGH